MTPLDPLLDPQSHTATTVGASWEHRHLPQQAAPSEFPIIVRQSLIKRWQECPLKVRYERIDGLRPLQSGSLTFGSIIHHCVQYLEESADLEGAVERFTQLWCQPTDLGAEYSIDYYVRGTSWKRYLEEGPRVLRDWWALHSWDSDVVLVREYGFEVPIGNGHTLQGTIDRLKVTYRADIDSWVLQVDDYKTYRKAPTYDYLAEDLQFSAYCFATTQPEFWENLPGGRGPELMEKYADYPRYGQWIALMGPKRMDAGPRTERHYNRLAMAVNALALSYDLRLFVPNISGESCRYCLAGETEFWTADGVKTLKETAGTEQMVLSRGRSGGIWTPARISSFGVQELRTIVLKRNKVSRIIRATPDHRWFVRLRRDPARTEACEVDTSGLREGDVLLATLPRPRTEKVVPSPIGIQAGIVFGDGCQPMGRHHSEVTLHGAKQSLMPYFQGHAATGASVHGLPKFLKAAPDVNESASYLLGWLMGYMATDGSVSLTGQVTLSSARRDHIELARLVAARVGIATHEITSEMRLGTGVVPTPLYRIGLVNSTLTHDFFLLDHHRRRFVPRLRSQERLEWTVVEVRDDNEREEVFCATVPEHENFTLDGWINTHNCEFRRQCGLPELVEAEEWWVA